MVRRRPLLYHNLDESEAAHFEDVGGVPIMRNDEVALRPATPDVLTELYTQEAVGFISRNKDKPFFLYLAHTMPADPESPAFDRTGLILEELQPRSRHGVA